MSTTRRTFLKTSAGFAAALPLARFALGQNADMPPGQRAMPPGAATAGQTPRGLLFDPAQVPAMRANLDDPRCGEIRAKLLNVDFATETRFLEKELRLNDHVADFLRAWQLLQNAAFAFAIFGDERQRALAELALRRLLDYKRWDYFLEGGTDTIGLQRAPEATIAVCYALDWMGDALPAELRARAEHKVATEGAPACYRTLYGLKYPDRVRGWGFDPEDDYPFRFDLSRWPLILNSTNLKVIPTCGLGIAAIWLHGRHPQADQWLQLARQSAQAFSTMYGYDGAYDEGTGYWGYTTLHLAMFADALHRRLGIDDRKLINYPGTVRYALVMWMPCAGGSMTDPKAGAAYNAVPHGDYNPAQDVVNFSDAASGLDVTIAPWTGRVAQDPLSNYVGRHVGGLKEIQAAVWYNPAAPEQPPGPELHDVRLSNDWVVSRTGWRPEDGVVALRSGGPSNHEHADRNSVIFKVYGDRLFHDPFHAGYSPKVPRWELRQTEAHTAILIDGHGHQYIDGHEGTNSSWASAHVTDFRTGADWMTVSSDATEAYALVLPYTLRVTRTLLFLKPDVLLILDHVRLKTPAPVQARFQVFNDDGRGIARAAGATAAIERPFAAAHLQFAGFGPVAARTGNLPLPATEGIFPFVELTSAPATEHVILTTTTAAPAGETPGALTVERQGTAWRISGRHRGRMINAVVGLSADGEPRVAT